MAERRLGPAAADEKEVGQKAQPAARTVECVRMAHRFAGTLFVRHRGVYAVSYIGKMVTLFYGLCFLLAKHLIQMQFYTKNNTMYTSLMIWCRPAFSSRSIWVVWCRIFLRQKTTRPVGNRWLLATTHMPTTTAARK